MIGDAIPRDKKDECEISGCIYYQFGEYETCRYHTEHMKHKISLSEFMEKG